MTLRKRVGVVLQALVLATFALGFPIAAAAAPYAALVMDARTGKVLHSRNADTRLHPASLTKMMTLYVVFDAIERGEISLDDEVTITKKAASEPPSKLGLKAGQKIRFRYLIRAAAVKSANDAATALGEGVAGSEAAFARRMNRTAQALGMTRSTFRNANGLTEEGHLSTARDMTLLGRRLFYDFPQYYNIFSRRSTDAGGRTVNNTNRKFLDAYRGADGIKTGYTRAAGFNLTASAERGNERIIATVLGERSVAARNARMAELLDMGFGRAPSNADVVLPPKPMLLSADIESPEPESARVSGILERSRRPAARPVAGPAEEVLVAMADGIADALAEVAVAGAAEASTPEPDEAETLAGEAVAMLALSQPAAAPEAADPVPAQVAAASLVAGAFLRPAPRPMESAVALEDTTTKDGKPVVVTRLSTSGGQHWGINVGRYTTRNEAERVLLQTALSEMSTLDSALRKVVQSPRGWEANFVGLTEERAELACRRLQAQNVNCTPVGPG